MNAATHGTDEDAGARYPQCQSGHSDGLFASVSWLNVLFCCDTGRGPLGSAASPWLTEFTCTLPWLWPGLMAGRYTGCTPGWALHCVLVYCADWRHLLPALLSTLTSLTDWPGLRNTHNTSHTSEEKSTTQEVWSKLKRFETFWAEFPHFYCYFSIHNRSISLKNRDPWRCVMFTEQFTLSSPQLKEVWRQWGMITLSIIDTLSQRWHHLSHCT